MTTAHALAHRPMPPEELVAFRAKHDVSQEDLAKVLGITRASLSRYERPPGAPPPVAWMVRQLDGEPKPWRDASCLPRHIDESFIYCLRVALSEDEFEFAARFGRAESTVKAWETSSDVPSPTAQAYMRFLFYRLDREDLVRLFLAQRGDMVMDD